MVCNRCGSDRLIRRGKSLQCKDCGKYTPNPDPSRRGESSEVEYGRDYINVVCASNRILTADDLIRELKIDTNVWELEPPLIVKTSEGYRKDRQVEWDVKKGKVTNGRVRDTGKMLVVPLYHVKARFKLKVQEIRANHVFDLLEQRAKLYSPKASKTSYPKVKDGMLYEIAMPDLQLGRMVDKNVTGHELTPEISIRSADAAIESLMGYIQNFPLERILFPIGNDFFDSDNLEMTTVHGTFQYDDPRWQMIFDMGSDFMVRTIDALKAVAPVDVLVIPGNHDESRIYYLGAYLSAWYRNDSRVNINNSPKLRKYYSFGKNLIGFTHGYYEKSNELDSLMAYEEPDLWAASVYREWHVGDLHHKKDMVLKAHERKNGVVVRILRSLATPSDWEYRKAFVGSLQAAEGFLWHPGSGVIGQFTST